MGTRRQQIVELLERGPITARELAKVLELRLRDVVDDLGHVQRSLRGRARLEIGAVACDACGFAITKRTRFTAPSRCPKCRSERIGDPLLRVVARDP